MEKSYVAKRFRTRRRPITERTRAVTPEGQVRYPQAGVLRLNVGDTVIVVTDGAAGHGGSGQRGSRPRV